MADIIVTPGSPTVVTISPPTVSPVIITTATGPKGDTGATGASGATGATGAAGADGKTYVISCVDGDNSDEEKIRLTDSEGTTDDVVLEAGTGMSIARSGDKITLTNTVTDTNTQLTTEQVQDIVGGMLTGNTETRISVEYQDSDGTIDFTVSDMTADTNLGNTDQTLAAARDVELGGNSLTFSNSDTVVHTISPTTGVTFNRGINVTGTASSGATITLREDTDNGTDGVVLKAPSTLGSSLTLTLPSADGSDGHFLKTDGAGNLSFAADNDTNTQLSTEEVQDIVGGMFTGNTETGIAATYEDSDGTIDLVVSGGGYKLLQTYSYSDTGTTDKFFVQNATTELSGSNAARDYRSAYAIPVAGSIGDCTMVGASAVDGNAYRLYVWVNNTSTYYAEATGGNEAGSRYTVRWTSWKNVSDDSTASDPSFSANDYLAFQLVPTASLANPGSVSLSVLTSHT